MRNKLLQEKGIEVTSRRSPPQTVAVIKRPSAREDASAPTSDASEPTSGHEDAAIAAITAPAAKRKRVTDKKSPSASAPTSGQDDAEQTKPIAPVDVEGDMDKDDSHDVTAGVQWWANADIPFDM